MGRSTIILAFLFLLIRFNLTAQDWKSYPYTPEGSVISFPDDEGAHTEEPIEWWYTNGHVVGENTGTHYSFMLTYFDYAALGFDGFRILNISNDDTGEFYPQTAPITFTTLAEDSLNLRVSVFGGGQEFWIHKTSPNGTPVPFEYQISTASASSALDLHFEAVNPPLILGDSGFFYQGEAAYTYYYSQTGISVNGSITVNGLTEPVNGTAWIDRQYGSFNPNIGEKYEWFSVQLDNGMDLNIFNIFTDDNRLPETLNYRTLGVYLDEANSFTTADFEMERLQYTYTPDSVRCYAQKWRLSSPREDIDLIIETAFADYEVTLPFRFYEGPTAISGTVDGSEVSGVGFAELLHAYERPDVSIKAPGAGSWGPENPIRWTLSNPDDGRPVQYALEYSEDGENFLPLAVGITDTLYSWEEAPTVSGDRLWVRLTAYSVDSTLVQQTTMDTDVMLSAGKQDGCCFEVYPNPTSEQLHIQLHKNYRKIDLKVMNLEGKSFTPEWVRNGRDCVVEMDKLSPGIYLGVMSLDDEEHLFRFIME